MAADTVLLAVSDQVTIAIAIVSGIAGVAGGGITALVGASATRAAAKQQKEASIETAAQTRFASWQLSKREVYAEFLRLARVGAKAGT